MGTTAVRTARRLLLGREIRHAITLAGASQAQAADLIRVRPQKMADVIAGKATIRYGELLTLASGLGLTPELTDVLVGLHEDSDKRGAWSTGAYHEDFRLMVDLERSGDLLRCMDSEIAPDLLQCEAYIRSLFVAQEASDSEMESWVQARLQRQAVLDREELQYHAVLSESCLWREYGGASVMREQLAHMNTMSERKNVVMQILPFRERAIGTQVATKPFVLARVPSPGTAGPLEVCYLQGEKETRYIDTAKALDAYNEKWKILTKYALPPEDSRRYANYILARNYANRRD